jgi:hypothetical protein
MVSIKFLFLHKKAAVHHDSTSKMAKAEKGFHSALGPAIQVRAKRKKCIAR